MTRLCSGRGIKRMEKTTSLLRIPATTLFLRRNIARIPVVATGSPGWGSAGLLLPAAARGRVGGGARGGPPAPGVQRGRRGRAGPAGRRQKCFKLPSMLPLLSSPLAYFFLPCIL